MIHLDRFFDTIQKRTLVFLLIAIGCFFLLSFTYVNTSFVLLSISDYEDVFTMLELGSAEGSYLARVILSCMSMPTFEITAFMKALLTSLNILDMSIMIFIFIWLFDAQFKLYKKILYRIISLYICMLIVISVIALFTTTAASLMEVVYNLYYIAYTLLFFHFILIIFLSYHMYHLIKQYREALCYHIEEIIEQNV